jgi:hypothetical protein
VRRVLDGVPKIAFYEQRPLCPEDLCLPSVMRSLAGFLKDPLIVCGRRHAGSCATKVPCAYSFFAGVTGAAFFLSWKEGWRADNVAASYMDADPAAMERRAFEALGYGFERVDPSGADRGATLRRRIVESIDTGMPVISYGLFGPPEPGLVTGYDAGGDVLVGWNFFQNMDGGCQKEPTGQYRKADWEKDIAAIVVIGEKRERPGIPVLFRGAVERAVRILRTTSVADGPDAPEGYRGRRHGPAGFDAWAGSLGHDADFDGADEATLRQRHFAHDNCVGTLAEARWYGNRFLVDMTGFTDAGVHRDAVEGLLAAAALFAGEHSLMWKVWDRAGGIGNPEAWRRFAEPGVRRSIAPLILEARDKDMAAARALESALAAM